MGCVRHTDDQSFGIHAQGHPAYRSLDSEDQAADLDATPYDLITIFDRFERQHQASFELQAFDDASHGHLDWIGGLLYFDELPRSPNDSRRRTVRAGCQRERAAG